MVCGIVSIMSLGVEPKCKETGEEDITSLLNSRAHHFLRTDYLEGLWKMSVDRYVEEERKDSDHEAVNRRNERGDCGDS
jgi:hypothetical protein